MERHRHIRRVAANSVVMPDMTLLSPGVVQIENGIVTDTFVLTREHPFTEWIGGRLRLRKSKDDKMVAYKGNMKIE